METEDKFSEGYDVQLVNALNIAKKQLENPLYQDHGIMIQDKKVIENAIYFIDAAEKFIRNGIGEKHGF